MCVLLYLYNFGYYYYYYYYYYSSVVEWPYRECSKLRQSWRDENTHL